MGNLLTERSPKAMTVPRAGHEDSAGVATRPWHQRRGVENVPVRASRPGVCGRRTGRRHIAAART